MNAATSNVSNRRTGLAPLLSTVALASIVSLLDTTPAWSAAGRPAAVTAMLAK
jgi:hypothetical protein